MLNGRQKKNFNFFLIIVSFVAFGQGLGLGGSIMGNFFKEVYNTSTIQRGLIELPREIPGILTIFALLFLSSKSDIIIAFLSQLFCIFASLFITFWTPGFTALIVVLLINSLGMHLFFPLQESIGMAIAGEQLGKNVSKIKSVQVIFTMAAGLLAFLGFKFAWFTFEHKIKLVFLISALSYLFAAVLFLILNKKANLKIRNEKMKLKSIFKKDYTAFYSLAALSGAQKQIMAVFAPWMMIIMLKKDAGFLAMITFIGSFIGIFWVRIAGNWTDKFGAKKMLVLDAIIYIFIYLAYAVLAWKISENFWIVLAVSAVYILDSMSLQLSMVRSVYLNSILIDKNNLSQILAMGITFEHVLAVVIAGLGGVIWQNFGAGIVFVIASVLSAGNLLIALRIRPQS